MKHRTRLVLSVFMMISSGLINEQAWSWGTKTIPLSGSWDAGVYCEFEGENTLSTGHDAYTTIGQGPCEFKDTANNSFQETGLCSLSMDWSDLDPVCTENDDKTSTLTVTGKCPTDNGGASLNGAVNCSGGALNENDNPTDPPTDPSFCTYAGTDPYGNSTGDCTWNLGFGYRKGNGNNYVALTEKQCQAAFGDDPVFSLTVTYAGTGCEGRIVKIGSADQDFAHSDSWDGTQPAYIKFDKKLAKNAALSKDESIPTADTEYDPQSFQCGCQNSGQFNLEILSDAQDPGTDSIDASQINEGMPITVNGRQVNLPGRYNPDSGIMTYSVNRCEDGVNITALDPDNDGESFKLNLSAQMIGGNLIKGDTEIRKISCNN